MDSTLDLDGGLDALGGTATREDHVFDDADVAGPGSDREVAVEGTGEESESE